jgi:hypothetical protein
LRREVERDAELPNPAIQIVLSRAGLTLGRTLAAVRAVGTLNNFSSVESERSQLSAAWRPNLERDVHLIGRRAEVCHVGRDAIQWITDVTDEGDLVAELAHLHAVVALAVLDAVSIWLQSIGVSPFCLIKTGDSGQRYPVPVDVKQATASPWAPTVG